MPACPSQDLIVALLAERLAEPELADVVAHIEECLRCQTHLEELTRPPGRMSTLEDGEGEEGPGARRPLARPTSTITVPRAMPEPTPGSLDLTMEMIRTSEPRPV